ncbi:hypothetical protein B0H16DRAFT_1512993 [Mycena metata]|uniref:Uncharacterized protein n=1 Tax=Mycena metata TaxID=1033252 RepID=A0AAD7JXD4_9AGAR|nr:hypothetical protein B0H16DRAFT_1512993 [Mycena metata]
MPYWHLTDNPVFRNLCAALRRYHCRYRAAGQQRRGGPFVLCLVFGHLVQCPCNTPRCVPHPRIGSRRVTVSRARRSGSTSPPQLELGTTRGARRPAESQMPGHPIVCISIAGHCIYFHSNPDVCLAARRPSYPRGSYNAGGHGRCRCVLHCLLGPGGEDARVVEYPEYLHSKEQAAGAFSSTPVR